MKKVLRKKKRAYTKRSTYWGKPTTVTPKEKTTLVEKIGIAMSILDSDQFGGIDEFQKLTLSALFVAGYRLGQQESGQAGRT